MANDVDVVYSISGDTLNKAAGVHKFKHRLRYSPVGATARWLGPVHGSGRIAVMTDNGDGTYKLQVGVYAPEKRFTELLPFVDAYRFTVDTPSAPNMLIGVGYDTALAQLTRIGPRKDTGLPKEGEADIEGPDKGVPIWNPPYYCSINACGITVA